MTKTDPAPLIDYAKPLINVEFMTRVIHDACLSKNYKGAKDISIELAAEVKLLINALTLMQEAQEKADADFMSKHGHL
jgi:hypothetical protein